MIIVQTQKQKQCLQRDIVIIDERKNANLMNYYFVNITKKLNLKPTVSSIDCDYNLDSFHGQSYQYNKDQRNLS